MREVVGDLWDFHEQGHWVAITTNLDINSKGHAIMGRGTALQAAQRYPDLPKSLAFAITLDNRPPRPFFWPTYRLVTVPVKRHWYEDASIDLIVKSARYIVWWINKTAVPDRLYLPQPGTGAGNLSWDTQVRPILTPIFDDRFTVVSLP